MDLAFTHHHSHGGDDPDRADHVVASHEHELADIVREFPEVFSTPSYPIERDTPGFDHVIRLRDETADPPRRRLYPLN